MMSTTTDMVLLVSSSLLVVCHNKDLVSLTCVQIFHLTF